MRKPLHWQGLFVLLSTGQPVGLVVKVNNRLTECVDSSTDLAVCICSDSADFRALRPEWEELRQSAEDQDPFLSCDWFACWWRAFGGDRNLHLVTVRRRGLLQAVLPMMLEKTRFHGVPMRRLVAIGNDHTPRFDLVRDRDDASLHRRVWDHLMSIQADWDMLDFPRLSSGSTTTERFVQYAREQGLHYNLWHLAPRSPWIDLRPSWEEYLGSRSAGFRKALRRKYRQLDELGEVSLETLNGSDELAEALSDGMSIEAEGCKGSSRTAMSSQTAVTTFYTQLAEHMAGRAQLRLHFLKLGGARIAFDYSIAANRFLYSLKAGYQDAYARWSPGTLLLAHMVQQAHEEGFQGIDLLGESDAFKRQWTDLSRAHQWLHCYSDSWPGRLAHLFKARLSPRLHAASL